MKIVSITELLECNSFIKGRGLDFRIHLRDACGKQSCRIESLSDKNGEEQYEKLYQALEDFFNRFRFKLEYGEGKTDFWFV